MKVGYFNPTINAREMSKTQKRKMKERAVWLPKKVGKLRILKSGASYEVSPKGPWIRINHPRNKHDRRNDG